MSPEEVKRKIKIIRYMHYVIFFLFFVSVYLILFSPMLSIYGAVAILAMGVVQMSNGGHCPLTLVEHKAQIKIGDNVHRPFVESVFKELFNLDVSNFYINIISSAAYVLSGFVFVSYLIDIFKSL